MSRRNVCTAVQYHFYGVTKSHGCVINTAIILLVDNVINTAFILKLIDNVIKSAFLSKFFRQCHKYCCYVEVDRKGHKCCYFIYVSGQCYEYCCFIKVVDNVMNTAPMLNLYHSLRAFLLKMCQS
jgi:hypothetical protein